VEWERGYIVRTAVIGRRWRYKWERVAGGALTIIVLLAVAIVGPTLFGSEVLAAWKAPGDAEQALSSDGPLERLLSFDAPAVLNARLKTQTVEAVQSIRKAENAILLTRNWKYTQSPTADSLALSLNLYVSALQAEIALSAFDNFMDQLQINVAASNSPFAPFINNVLAGFEDQVISFLVSYINAAAALQSLINPLIPASFRPPPIPAASPCAC
jgi:hypothetical protein